MGARKVAHTENLGKKFGRLTVKEVIPKGKYYYYNCICDCGEGVTAASFSIIKGKQVSCGCYHSEQNAKRLTGAPGPNRKPGGESSFNYLWHTYNRNARKRNIEFSLTREEFKTLTIGNCEYCGRKPNRAVKHLSQKRTYVNPYLHNGVDRVDNTLGYTLDNSVPCCRDCNVGKGIKTVDEFKLWIERVYKHGIH